MTRLRMNKKVISGFISKTTCCNLLEPVSRALQYVGKKKKNHSQSVPVILKHQYSDPENI